MKAMKTPSSDGKERWKKLLKLMKRAFLPFSRSSLSLPHIRPQPAQPYDEKQVQFPLIIFSLVMMMAASRKKEINAFDGIASQLYGWVLMGEPKRKLDKKSFFLSLLLKIFGRFLDLKLHERLWDGKKEFMKFSRFTLPKNYSSRCSQTVR